MELQNAMVVLTASDGGILARLIHYCTGSWWTHCFIVTGPDEGVEAYFPRVRRLSVSKRLAELDAEGRGWMVLDRPRMSPVTRESIAAKARQYVGRLYDPLQSVIFLLVRHFVGDGPKRMVCSRLISAAYDEGGRIDIFRDVSRYAGPTSHLSAARIAGLRKGYCTPADLCDFSILEVVAPQSAANPVADAA